MPFVSCSREQKAEAIALCRVIGVEQASQQLHIRAATLRNWLGATGLSAGGSELDSDELARFERLAYAKPEGDLVGGRITGQRLATTWGIVRDKLDRRNRGPKPVAPTVDPASVNVDAIDQAFPSWRPDLVKRHDGDAVSAFIEGISYFLRVEPPVELEDWLRTFDPDQAHAQYEAEQAEWHAEADGRRAEAWLKYAGCAPGGHPNYGQPAEPSEPIDVEALLAEADAFLEEIAADQMALSR